MSAFNDVSCPKCKKKFGFTGELKDCPPCPRCGHQIDPKDWEEAEAEMDKFRKELLARKGLDDDDDGDGS